MNIIHEKDIESYKIIFETQIRQKLQIKKKCKAILKNGNRCNNCPIDNTETCKKHENATNLTKQIKHITYHNHLPFEYNDNCPLCVK